MYLGYILFVLIQKHSKRNQAKFNPVVRDETLQRVQGFLLQLIFRSQAKAFLTDFSLVFLRWTTSFWAPLTLCYCVWLQAPLKVLHWTQVLLCRSTLWKFPVGLCWQTSLRWNQLTYRFSFWPEMLQACLYMCLTTNYKSLIMDVALWFTASDGHSAALHCNHRGEALDETADILWLWSDRGRCVMFIPLVCGMEIEFIISCCKVHDFVLQRWRSWMRTSMRKPVKIQEHQNAITLRTWKSVSLRSSWVCSPLTSCPMTSR